MIEMTHISKCFGRHNALTDVNLSVPKGQVLGLLGQNGAGKSTIMNILTGCLPPTEGQVVLGGQDMLLFPHQAKQMIGYLPEAAPLYEEMTVRSFLTFSARLKCVVEKAIPGHVEEVAERTGLRDTLSRRIGNLSKGYRQRVGLAQALCGSPDILVLDEPTSGLDPTQAAEFRQLIGDLSGRHTIVFSSHILSEVQSVCDRVVILHEGRMICDQTLHNAPSDAAVRLRAVIAGSVRKLLPAVRSLPCFTRVDALPGEDGNAVLLLTATPGASAEKRLFTLLAGLQMPLLRLMPVEDSLEDIFLRVTQNG
ncbi:MAG: ABC transporter ATP-binding protein [Clostridiales bacterium]|nr:ABC transporter ATP-binding protein [Clostridiales bacterium]